VAAGLVAAAAPSQAALVTSCTGTASDVTVPGDLFVPAGESCELTNVTINGNTTVRADSNLFLMNSRVNGTLTVQSNGFVDAEQTTITGATHLNTAFGAFVQDATLGGNVTATDSGFFFSVGTSHQAINSTNGETFLETGMVARGITTSGDLLTDLDDTVVGGAVMVSTATLGSVLCASEVDGAASFTGGGTLQLGGTAPVADCAFNVFASTVTANGNSDIHIFGNVIRGMLACADNGSAEGADNRLRGGASGQCASLAPAAAASRTSSKAESRKESVQTKIASRSRSGEQAAAKAGVARIGKH